MEILLGEATYRLVKDAVDAEAVEPLQLKGIQADAGVSICIRRTPRGRGRPAPRCPDGRREQLRGAHRRPRQGKDTNSCHVVTVVAPAGTGKSRLLNEFVTRSDAASAPWAMPLLRRGPDVLASCRDRARGGGDRHDDPSAEAQEKLASLLGPAGRDVAGPDRRARSVSRPRPTRWRRHSGPLVDSSRLISDGRPLIVLIDDIHWAERTFLDLIDRSPTR